MDYRLHKIDSEEKNRILSLHESATKKEYLITGKKPLFEQGSADRMVDNKSRELASNASNNNVRKYDLTKVESIAQQIYNASNGPGTDEAAFLSAVKDIESKEEFFMVDRELKKTGYSGGGKGFKFFVKSEMGYWDKDTVGGIERHLKSIGVNLKSTSDWPEEYICISNHSEAQKVALRDGSIAYKLNGEVFYNNGRKKTKEGKMVNYSCDQIPQKGGDQVSAVEPGKGGDQVSAVEPGKGGDQVSAVEPQKERGMNDTQKVQQELGVTVDGKVGPETINAMYNALTK